MNPLVIKWFSVGRGKVIQKSLLLLDYTDKSEKNKRPMFEGKCSKIKACSSQCFCLAPNGQKKCHEIFEPITMAFHNNCMISLNK